MLLGQKKEKMDRLFTVKNFRIFDEKGTSFCLKPITLLTGQNGSGKSSLTKAIMLMHDFLTKELPEHSSFNPISQALDFTRPSLKLGGFDIEKNYNSDSDYISFGYSVCPRVAYPYLTFDVEYRFRKKDEDDTVFNNGVFDSLIIRHDGDEIVSIEAKSSGRYNASLFNIEHLPLIISFVAFCIIINLLRIDVLQGECKDSNGLIVDLQRYNKLEQTKDGFREVAKKLPKPLFDFVMTYHSSIAYDDRRDILEELSSRNSFIINPDLLREIERFRQNDGAFFYFEVLRELDLKTKEEVVEILRKQCLDFSEGTEFVFMEFLKGEYKTISDYFLALEKENLENMGNQVCDYPGSDFMDQTLNALERYLGDDSFESYVSKLLGIKYDSSSRVSIGKFQTLYNCLCRLELEGKPTSPGTHIICWKEANTYSSKENVRWYAKHTLYSAYIDFLTLLIRDVVNPQWIQNILYLGDAHANIQRTHSLSDKNDIVVSRVIDYIQTAKKLFTHKSIRTASPLYEEITQAISHKLIADEIKRQLTEEQKERYCRLSFTNYWLSELGIGEKVLIDLDKNNMSLTLRIVKNSQKNKTVLLADEGYGIYQLVLILISIETEINKLDLQNSLSIFNNNPYSRYGLSSPKTLILEEPEANLHPAFQTKLAYILYDAQKRSHGLLSFIVETHSEYLIRATQAIVANTVDEKSQLKEVPFIVYYIEKGGKAYDMEYQVSGRFNKPFGTGFFDEAGKSSLEIIRKERRMANGKDA